MTLQVEDQLRELFAEDARRAPVDGGLADGVVRQVKRRRRIQFGAVALPTIVILVAGGLAFAQRDNQSVPTPMTAPSATQRSGALPDGATASCVYPPDDEHLAERAFAFDGTVTAIGSPRTNRSGNPHLPLASVTFRVNEWFRGGHGPTSVVDVDALGEDSPPPYEIGTRLLVSGEPRWGGKPLDNAIAWGCGFTRYYDTDAVASWRNAFR